MSEIPEIRCSVETNYDNNFLLALKRDDVCWLSGNVVENRRTDAECRNLCAVLHQWLQYVILLHQRIRVDALGWGHSAFSGKAQGCVGTVVGRQAQAHVAAKA